MRLDLEKIEDLPLVETIGKKPRRMYAYKSHKSYTPKDVRCSGKRVYKRIKDAEYVKLMQTRAGRATYLRIYPCSIANHWHLTSKPPRAKERPQVSEVAMDAVSASGGTVQV